MKSDLIQIPEYDYKKDITLVNCMFASAYITPMYATFIGYMVGAMRYIWLAGAVLLAYAVWFSGRKMQMLGAKLLKFDKPEYDPDKEAADYIKKSKSIISLLFSLAVGVLFFFAALLIHKYYQSNVDDKTMADAAGYIYEIMAGVFGLVSAYIPALFWFIPDDVLYSNEIGAIYFIIPIGMILISYIYTPAPVYLIVPAVLAYAVMFLVRYRKIRNYNYTVKKMRSDAEYEAHRSKHGW